MAAGGFSESQLQRYARHIVLPEVGGKGQRRLLSSRVAVMGAGGLGSPILMYLAAAGVGTIDVIDSDRVDLTNLHRQVIHGTQGIGMAKTESAKAAIAAINPDVRVVTHDAWLSKENALDVFAHADVIVEGSDNFSTRYLVNDAAWFLKKPLVSGALFRFEGQVTVFPNDGAPTSPCYRCLFAEAPPPGAVPTCREAGVLGAIPGVIGSLQAVEVLKILLGTGEPLAGRLLLYDGLAASFRELRITRDPDCVLNGDSPSVHGLGDYGPGTVCEG